MKFKFSLPPTTNSTYRAVYSSHLKRTVFFSSYESKKWKKQAEEVIGQQKIIENPVQVNIKWFLKFSRDIDGGIKLILDGLQGTIIKNDSQVNILHIEKFKTKDNPRVEVEVLSIDTV